MICEYCQKDFVHSKIKKRCCSVVCNRKLWYIQHKDYKKAYNKEYYERRKAT